MPLLPPDEGSKRNHDFVLSPHISIDAFTSSSFLSCLSSIFSLSLSIYRHLHRLAVYYDGLWPRNASSDWPGLYPHGRQTSQRGTFGWGMIAILIRPSRPSRDRPILLNCLQTLDSFSSWCSSSGQNDDQCPIFFVCLFPQEEEEEGENKKPSGAKNK